MAGSLDVDKIGELSRADIAERLGVRGVQMESIDFERLTENGVLCNQRDNMCQDQFHKVSSQYYDGAFLEFNQYKRHWQKQGELS